MPLRLNPDGAGSWHAATSMGGSIMVVGGNNGTHHTCSAEILRVETAPSGPRAGWTAVQSMSYKRYAPAACSVGGRCIAAGGHCAPHLCRSWLPLGKRCSRMTVWNGCCRIRGTRRFSETQHGDAD
eukprot:2114883-Rhodomonas_salina.2